MEEKNLINIIEKAKNGEEESFELLFLKYKNYIDRTSFSKFIRGAGIDDVIQHGYIGLWNAVKYFNKEKVVDLDSFIKLCIKREIYTAIKTADRKKHKVFNNAFSIEKKICENPGGLKLKDVILGISASPEEEVIENESENLINIKLDRLPKMQSECMRLYIKGFKQSEICKILNLKSKQVDNALNRAKTNLKLYFRDLKSIN